MGELAREIAARLRDERIDPAALCRAFDAASHAERVRAARSLGRAEQRALYRAVEGALPLRLSDLVPPGVEELAEVRHHGRNTLPAFRHFEKRICRPRGADRDRPAELYGYNAQRLARLSGPGYFVALEDAERGEVRIDYRRLPAETPSHWPALRSNEHGLARLVFGFLVDTLRRVSEHVTIGTATRHGRELGSWFVLVREDPPQGGRRPSADAQRAPGERSSEGQGGRRPSADAQRAPGERSSSG